FTDVDASRIQVDAVPNCRIRKGPHSVRSEIYPLRNIPRSRPERDAIQPSIWISRPLLEYLDVCVSQRQEALAIGGIVEEKFNISRAEIPIINYVFEAARVADIQTRVAPS